MKVVSDVVRMFDFEPDIGRRVILDEPMNCQQVQITTTISDQFLSPLKLRSKLTETYLILYECICRYFLSSLLPRIYMYWWRYVGLYYALFILLVWRVHDQYDAEFVFLNKKKLTFLLKEVSENLMLQKVASPFLLNYLKVSPSSLTSSK